MVYTGSMSPNAVAYATVDVRAAFIRKVYSLFFASLLVTVGVGWFCIQPAMLPVVFPLMWPLMIAGFISIVALNYTRQMSGVNLGLLFLFAAIQGAILGPLLLLADRAAPGLPTQAAALTIAVFGGLSLYAIQSKRDFSFMGGMLFVGLIALIVAGIVLMFFHSSMLGTLYALGGVLIFSGYVLYDTSMIMQRLGPDQAVTGAVSLYLDFLNLFLFILRLLNGRK